MKQRVCILGGTGFVGQHLVSQLNTAGYRIRVLTRRRERHRELLVLPNVEVIDTDIHQLSNLQKLFSGQDVIINLVGILNERKDNGRGFHHAHVELSEKVIQACRHNHISRVLHMSALHADAQQGSSYYLQTKGAAEDLMHSSGLNVTSFRPSVIFGPHDSFINRFAAILKKSPYLFPLACADSRFAPVFVEDVAAAFVRSLNNSQTYGQRYELCGPRQYSLQQIVSYVCTQLGLKRKIIPLPRFAALLQANLLEYFPGKPFSRDNFRSLQTNSVCKDNTALTQVFGIQAASMETIVPSYLANQRVRAQLDTFRSKNWYR